MDVNPFDHMWLYRTDKKGRMVFFASGFQKLFEGTIGGFYDHPFIDLIEFEKIYKWPKLQARNYNIQINPHKISFVTDGKVWRYENSMYLSEVKGTFPNGATNLASYINQKINELNLINFLTSHRLNKSASERIVSSRKTSMVLSSSLKLDKSWNIVDGCPDIFESDDLLDQLLIYILVKYSRWGDDGHTIALITLISLFDDKINYIVRSLFRNVKEDDVEFLISEMRDLSFQIIKDDKRLKRKGDHFELNKVYSLGFFIAAPIRTEKNNKKYFISKIQEHLADYRQNIERSGKILPKTMAVEGAEDASDDDFFGADPSFDPSKHLDELDTQRGYMKLPPEDKILFQQRFVNGETLEEIGKRLKLSRSAISKRIDKMILRLRKYAM